MVVCHGFCPLAEANANLQLDQPSSKATNSPRRTAINSLRDAVCVIRLSPFFDDPREGYSGVFLHSI
jgi:hypothetical protein